MPNALVRFPLQRLRRRLRLRERVDAVSAASAEVWLAQRRVRLQRLAARRALVLSVHAKNKLAQKSAQKRAANLPAARKV